MRKRGCFLFVITMFISFVPCLSAQGTSQASPPEWISSHERAYPSRDWIAVVAEGTSQAQAENAAMSSLARAFRTDVNSLTQSAQRYTQVISGAAGEIKFDESRNFSQQVNVNSNIRGLIGVQVEVYRREGTRNVRPAAANETTFFVLARMNRRECSARYSAIINENSNVINRLLLSAQSEQTSLSAYSKLSFAHSIARETDNFQSILEVLDPTAVNRKPNYGTANAIKVRMLEIAGLITIGVDVTTEQSADRILFIRAAGSFFRDLGFRTNEHSIGNYNLSINVRFEDISQNVFSCRYYIDASLTDINGTAVFSFTEDDRKAHPTNANEARRLAVRAIEESFKEGQFAGEFNTWLISNN